MTVSAAWIWTRIKRLGTSRRSLMQEELGYIDGGTADAVIDALTASIAAQRRHDPSGRAGGARSSSETGGPPASSWRRGGGLRMTRASRPFPRLTSHGMIPGLPESSKAIYDAIPNIAVACLIFRLKQPVTPHFWVNIGRPAA